MKSKGLWSIFSFWLTWKFSAILPLCNCRSVCRWPGTWGLTMRKFLWMTVTVLDQTRPFAMLENGIYTVRITLVKIILLILFFLDRYRSQENARMVKTEEHEVLWRNIWIFKSPISWLIDWDLQKVPNKCTGWNKLKRDKTICGDFSGEDNIYQTHI